MNIKYNANVIDIGEGRVSLAGFEDFIVNFSDKILGKEIAGIYYGEIGSGEVQYAHIGAVQNNTFEKSHSVPNIYTVRPSLYNRVQPLARWHTHSSIKPWEIRNHPSSEDLDTKKENPALHTNNESILHYGGKNNLLICSFFSLFFPYSLRTSIL